MTCSNPYIPNLVSEEKRKLKVLLRLDIEKEIWIENFKEKKPDFKGYSWLRKLKCKLHISHDIKIIYNEIILLYLDKITEDDFILHAGIICNACNHLLKIPGDKSNLINVLKNTMIKNQILDKFIEFSKIHEDKCT